MAKKKVKKSEVVAAAKELNEVLGLDPQIDVDGVPLGELKELVVEAQMLIEPADEISKKTEDIIEALASETAAEKEEEEQKEEQDPEPLPTQIAPPKNKNKREGEPGVVATISSLIEKAGQPGITKEEILEQLKGLFPNRDAKAMKNTVNVQVPTRISKEKFAVEKVEGRYRKILEKQ